MEHDKQHTHNELAQAACAYALHGVIMSNYIEGELVETETIEGYEIYPDGWSKEFWKPKKELPEKMTVKDKIRHLEIAGALLAAEIDRLLEKESNNDRK